MPFQSEESKKRSSSDYIFGKLIGEGSFSCVYLARDIHTSREYASNIHDESWAMNEPNAATIFSEDEQMEDDLKKDSNCIPIVSAIKIEQSADSEILKQLKQKFNDPSTPGPIKTMILTIAPKSWSENRLAKEFGTSRRQAKNAKELVKKYGIMSTQNPREGRKMELKTETLVKDFYLREDNSRVMPGTSHNRSKSMFQIPVILIPSIFGSDATSGCYSVSVKTDPITFRPGLSAADNLPLLAVTDYNGSYRH
ncbi:unnamed protein product [Brassicogethes aeneus]|uniref:Protein kinase domain-containing protein n=1 Tax=Brassicogethes aeneus TaxID=1431903 RepID=A0A9P0AS56_BRAAE|nr:unnamed protein product [Brassicogethes aeneus]